MRNQRFRAFSVLILLSLLGAGAAETAETQSRWTTGGMTRNGSPAAKRIKGRIADNVYTPQDKSFRVALPHPKGSYDFQYMQITEGWKEGDGLRTTYAVFGPAAWDSSVYHAVAIVPKGETTRPLPMLLADRAVFQFEGMTEYLHNEYGVVYRQILQKSITVHGREAVYAVYERGPWEDETNELQPNVQVVVQGPPPHLAMCAIDFGNGRFAFLIGEHQADWAERERNVDVPAGQWPRFDSLIQSFELTR